MRTTSIGELEELILLAIGAIQYSVYAQSIQDELLSHAKRKIDITAIHTVLRRLEIKGLIDSELGGISKNRGGRSKRLVKLTAEGRTLLDQTILIRMEFYKRLLKNSHS
ncbi:MAG: PadR family transcriptional regulator [Flammeovirgaceae bacterium]|nr:PadR family transcriptional regulator [Flammeovirgaceae bacterium]|tara:strand:+ start:765 stop:1091 length:327 start_codon:yes stop_codon:yes gene_type:complete